MPSSAASSPCPSNDAEVTRNPKAHNTGLPMPADYPTWAALETLEQLCRRYQRSESTIKRWRAELGLTGRQGFDVATTGQQRRMQPPPAVSGDSTPTQRAAQWLRKVGRIGNVFRCDILLQEHKAGTWGDRYNWARRDKPDEQLPDHGAGHYMVDGHGVVSVARMIDLAREAGFDE